MRRTKIVCTLGPASSSESVVENMLKSGMNVARLNFSHGDHAYHKNMLDTFRKVRDRLGYPAAVLLDTKGPEVRICNIADGKAELTEGAKFVLTTKEEIGNDQRVTITYADLPKKLSGGERILIDDGKIALKVDSVTETDVICTVTGGGTLLPKKSINVPNVSLNMPYLSEQDEKDILFGVENDVDFIAASFVRCKEDVIALRKLLDYNGGHSIRIIAKIENIEGVENFDEILEHSDGVMIARGDMGVEIAFERLPGIQKKFIHKCYSAGKMVITATQMLESMIHSTMPTRAEITDVANAVFDGTSAVMLSGETAMGDDPVLVVQTMAKIAEQAEHDAFDMNIYHDIQQFNSDDITNAICDAACTTARDINAKAIIAVTKSGKTARRVSKFRPDQPIVASTPDIKTYHQLALSWGVSPVSALFQDSEDALFRHAIDCARKIDVVENGDTVVITAGIPLNQPGTTNILKVETV